MPIILQPKNISNMNIQNNIETLLFGNDTYNSVTNSDFFLEIKILSFSLSRQKDFVLRVSSFRFYFLFCLPLIPNTCTKVVYTCFVVIILCVL